MSLRRWFSNEHVGRRSPKIAALVGLAAFLQIIAAVGLAYAAGFDTVRSVVTHVHWPWIGALAGAIGLSFAGYYYAYEGLYTVDGGESLKPGQMRAVVVAGFGGFLAHGGSSLDNYALRAAGASERDAAVRVTALAGMEHGILALAGAAAAIEVLISGRGKPPLDFTIPWAVIPVPGFLIAFWLAERYRGRLRDSDGWRNKLGIFYDAIHLTRLLIRRPFSHSASAFGMALFWFADILGLWSALAAFGVHMNGASLIVGYATGMVFTRRTGPLGGAGVLMCALPATLWVSGAPFAAAVVGVFAYRVVTLWLPMPFSIAALPTLRRIGQHGVPEAEQEAHAENEPALRREAS